VTHWQVGPYLFSSDGILRLGSLVIPLSPLQRKLLFCFVRHEGQLIERAQLFEEVWGHSNVSDVSLARAVHSLRQVFEKGPLGSGVISTTYGSGYVFSAPVQTVCEKAAEPHGEAFSAPSPLALEYYLEARVSSRHFDPIQLGRSQELLQRCLETSPTFLEAILFLVSVQLNRCRWGLLESQMVGTEVEGLLHRAEQLGAAAEDILPLRAEILSLLHWQPTLVEDTFGSWLPARLGYGIPMLSWVRHLLACGRAREGLSLLEPQLDGVLPMGWTLAAQLTFQLGETEAAMEMLRGQIRIDGSLPSSHLLLAVLQAFSGDRSAALTSLERCHQPGLPFHGFQAAVGYVLARVGETKRAEALLHRASVQKGQPPGMASLWGLSALVLGQESQADHFFQRAIAQRCYQAPFVARSPLLAPYEGAPAVKTFREQMAAFFPAIPSRMPQNKLGIPSR
jgi:DNA-binding winged helix-turn-helix (wHTH) protein